jgi:hypothetical protein
MITPESNRIATILSVNHDQVREQWLSAQAASGSNRPDLLFDAELRRPCVAVRATDRHAVGQMVDAAVPALAIEDDLVDVTRVVVEIEDDERRPRRSGDREDLIRGEPGVFDHAAREDSRGVKVHAPCVGDVERPSRNRGRAIKGPNGSLWSVGQRDGFNDQADLSRRPVSASESAPTPRTL